MRSAVCTKHCLELQPGMESSGILGVFPNALRPTISVAKDVINSSLLCKHEALLSGLCRVSNRISRGANACFTRSRPADLSVGETWLSRLASSAALATLTTAIGKALYPPFCAVCSVGTAPGAQLCRNCEEGAIKIRWELGRVCSQCSRVFSGTPPLVERCADCRAREPAFSCAVAPYHASGVVREVMHKFKYQGKRHLLNVLGPWLAEGLRDPRLQEPPPQVFVPVPLHWWKLRRRGFNQAALLAQQLVLEWERAYRLREQVQGPARELQCSKKSANGSANGSFQGPLGQTSGACLCSSQELRVEELLQRHRPTGTQTALDRSARLENLRGAFSLRKGANVIGRHLVLVDDVLTTGATLDACAQVLLSAGAASVRALAVARG